MNSHPSLIYTLDYKEQLSGRSIRFTKRCAQWRYGFANTTALEEGAEGEDCRGEEHVIAFSSSMCSGKKIILHDGQVIYSSKGHRSNQKFQFSWTVGHRVFTITSKPSHRRPSHLRIDDCDFSHMMNIFDLRLFRCTQNTLQERLGLPFSSVNTTDDDDDISEVTNWTETGSAPPQGCTTPIQIHEIMNPTMPQNSSPTRIEPNPLNPQPPRPPTEICIVVSGDDGISAVTNGSCLDVMANDSFTPIQCKESVGPLVKHTTPISPMHANHVHDHPRMHMITPNALTLTPLQMNHVQDPPRMPHTYTSPTVSDDVFSSSPTMNITVYCDDQLGGGQNSMFVRKYTRAQSPTCVMHMGEYV